MKSSVEANNATYPVLKSEIEQAFGKKINSYGDCLFLSDDIYAKISVRVSANTLRRFFGLIQSTSRPSTTTREILSRYCGFASFDEFTKIKETPHTTKEEYTKHYYSSSVLNYLISLFKDAPVYNCYDKTFLAVVRHTIYFLQRHPELIEKFQRAISKTENGQEFYYEYFINFDWLSSFYGAGLRYYLMEKNTPEAQIFGHALLCLQSWLSEDPEGVKRHHNEVMKHRLKKNFGPFVCARFFATQLLYADVCGLPVEKIIVTAQHTHAVAKQKTDQQRLFPYFEYIIVPILLLTGHADKALYYVNYAIENYPRQHADLDYGLYQSMDLLKALALVKTGRRDEADILYQDIHPSKFYFLSKKADTIMYIFLSEYLKRNEAGHDQQLKDLMHETGFIRLQRCCLSNQLFSATVS